MPLPPAEAPVTVRTTGGTFDADLFVTGSGSGGVRAARVAASYGARVVIAEEQRVGGTCVIQGRVPTNLLAHASHVAHELEDAQGFGWATLIRDKDHEIDRLEAVS